MHATKTTGTNWAIFQQWCDVRQIFVCNKNYSNVCKEMPTLSATYQNLEAPRVGG